MSDARPVSRRWWLLAPLLLLLAILPLGHVQALRTVLCCAVGIAALAARRELDNDARYLFVWWLAWLVFGLASALWSVKPELTLRSGVYELVLPAIAFFGAVCSMHDDRSLRVASVALALGIAMLVDHETTTAGLALITTMVLKNTTDDFMNYAIIITFWAIADMLVGVTGGRKAARATKSPS